MEYKIKEIHIFRSSGRAGKWNFNIKFKRYDTDEIENLSYINDEYPTWEVINDKIAFYIIEEKGD